MLKVFSVAILALTMLLGDAEAQTRRPRKEVKRISGETVDYWGAIAGFNRVTGFQYEMGLRNKSGAVSKSLFTTTVGYSSRLTTFENDFTLQKTTQWVHGVGLEFGIQNYVHKTDEGILWGLGIGGHVFFENTGTPKRFSNQVKNYAVFGDVGYRFDSGNWFWSPKVGVAIMGSSFKSSTGSDINGLFFTAGMALSMKRKTP